MIKKLAKNIILAVSVSVVPYVLFAQSSPPAVPQVATDVTANEIQAFIDDLPRDRVSDNAIRVVDITGDMRLGVFGVYRPMGVTGDVNVHLVNTTEIYYMLKGTATLVTGGELIEPYPANDTWMRAKGIEGGVSRRVGPGDVIVIPGHTPHFWSELESELEYLIFRPDPDNRLELK